MIKYIAILVFVISSCTFSFKTQAEETYEFYGSHAPIICGSSKEVLKFAEKEEWTPFTISFGKVGGDENGEIAFIVTTWLKQGTTQQMVTMQAPNGIESCILYISFDATVNPDLLPKGLNL